MKVSSENAAQPAQFTTASLKKLEANSYVPRCNGSIAVNTAILRRVVFDYLTAEYILAFINWRSDHSIENGSD